MLTLLSLSVNFVHSFNIFYYIFDLLKLFLCYHDLIHSKKGYISFKIFICSCFWCGLINHIEILYYFVEAAYLYLFISFQLLPNDLVDLSESSAKDRIKLVLYTILWSKYTTRYLPSMDLDISAQWFPIELWS